MKTQLTELNGAKGRGAERPLEESIQTWTAERWGPGSGPGSSWCSVGIVSVSEDEEVLEMTVVRAARQCEGHPEPTRGWSRRAVGDGGSSARPPFPGSYPEAAQGVSLRRLRRIACSGAGVTSLQQPWAGPCAQLRGGRCCGVTCVPAATLASHWCALACAGFQAVLDHRAAARSRAPRSPLT